MSLSSILEGLLQRPELAGSYMTVGEGRNQHGSLPNTTITELRPVSGLGELWCSNSALASLPVSSLSLRPRLLAISRFAFFTPHLVTIESLTAVKPEGGGGQRVAGGHSP